jgi:hypothetical protein
VSGTADPGRPKEGVGADGPTANRRLSEIYPEGPAFDLTKRASLVPNARLGVFQRPVSFDEDGGVGVGIEPESTNTGVRRGGAYRPCKTESSGQEDKHCSDAADYLTRYLFCSAGLI